MTTVSPCALGHETRTTEHGAQNTYHDAPNTHPATPCSSPACEGGYVRRTERGSMVMLPCPACTFRRTVEMKVPALYREARLAHFGAPVRAAVETWLAKPSAGLLLTGPCGTGKTHCAWAALIEWWHLRRAGVFWKAVKLYAEIRGCIRDHTSEETILGEASGARLLVLDDICSGKLSEHEREITLRIVDRRGEELQPTIVTTNSDLEKISAWDDRIASRLAAYTRIEFAGPDRRLETASH